MLPKSLSLVGNQNIKYVAIVVALSVVVYYVFTLERRINSLERLTSLDLALCSDESDDSEESATEPVSEPRVAESVVDSDDEKWLNDEFINNVMKEGEGEFTKCLELDLEGNSEVTGSEMGLEEFCDSKRDTEEPKIEELLEETEAEGTEGTESECCKATLKSGKNKGERCNKVNIIGGGYCRLHLK